MLEFYFFWHEWNELQARTSWGAYKLKLKGTSGCLHQLEGLPVQFLIRWQLWQVISQQVNIPPYIQPLYFFFVKLTYIVGY